jgi:release factor glutamine methyltransferase
MQIGKLLHYLTEELRGAGIEDAELEAEFILLHLLGCNRSKLYMHLRREFDAEQLENLHVMLERRRLREPLAYIFQEWDFRGLPFKVTPAVLIPRPETEQLVDWVISLWKKKRQGRRFERILDVGCGSGVISVSLALERIAAAIVAMDISLEALQVARQNALDHGVMDDIRFIQGDLRNMPFKKHFDLVVANLPYIDSGEVARLMPEVKDHEPREALDGGTLGTVYFLELADELEGILTGGGWVALEIGADQEDFIIELFSSRNYDSIFVLKDYASMPRIFFAQKKAD